jgi:hypothetical protein
MRLPRFRLRALMIAVTVAGLLIGGEMLRRRRVRYLGLAAGHAAMEVAHATRVRAARATPPIGVGGPGASLLDLGGTDPEAVEQALALARYHAAMRLKYERAAGHPWLSVEPDPLPPE